jgi:hypothetical protein
MAKFCVCKEKYELLVICSSHQISYPEELMSEQRVEVDGSPHSPRELELFDDEADMSQEEIILEEERSDVIDPPMKRSFPATDHVVSDSEDDNGFFFSSSSRLASSQAKRVPCFEIPKVIVDDLGNKSRLRDTWVETEKFHMCQTESCWLVTRSLTSIVPIHQLGDANIWGAERDSTYSFSQKTTAVDTTLKPTIGIPDCADLPEGKNWNEYYLTEHFVGWYTSQLNILSSYFPFMTGDDKDKANMMTMWLKKGTLRAPELVRQAFETISNKSSDMMTRLRRVNTILNITPELWERFHINQLKKWLPKPDADFQENFSSFLQLYNKVGRRNAENYDQDIKTMVTALMTHPKNSRIWQSYSTFNPFCVFSYKKNTKFRVLSVPPPDGYEISHFHMLCCISKIIDDHRCLSPQSAFKPRPKLLRPNNLRNFEKGSSRHGGFARARVPYNGTPNHKNHEYKKPQQNNHEFKNQVEKPQHSGNYSGNNHPKGGNHNSPAVIKTVKSIKNPTSLFDPSNYHVRRLHPSRDVTITLDSGNDFGTVFPSWLLKYATNVREINKTALCAGPETNKMRLTHEGTIEFAATTNEDVEARITISGVFTSFECDDGTVILGSDELDDEEPFGSNFVKVKSSPYKLLRTKYKTYWIPIEPHSDDNNFETRVLRVRESSTRSWSDSLHVTNKDTEYELEFGERVIQGTAERIIWKLHGALGHISIPSLQLTLLTFGMDVDTSVLTDTLRECRVCKYKPKKKKKAKSIDHGQKEKLAMIDITQPAVKGLGGHLYISNIIDCETGYCSSRACKTKDESAIHLASFLDKNPHINKVRMDGAGEYWNSKNLPLITSRGVLPQSIAPGGSESVGQVERLHQTVKNKISTFLSDLRLTGRHDFWPLLCEAAADAINLTAKANGSAPPAVLRAQKRGETKQSAVPKFLFGQVMQFKTPRDNPDQNTTVNGFRYGLYLSSEHSGVTSILGFEKEQIVYWRIHTTLVSEGDPKLKEWVLDRFAWYAQGKDNRKGIAQITLHDIDDQKERMSHILTYPYEGEDDEQFESGASEVETDDDASATGTSSEDSDNDGMADAHTPVKRSKAKQRYAKNSKQTQARSPKTVRDPKSKTPLHSTKSVISPKKPSKTTKTRSRVIRPPVTLPNMTLYTFLTEDSKVVLTTPTKGKVMVANVQNNFVDPTTTTTMDYVQSLHGSTPAVLLSNGKVIQQRAIIRRIQRKGTFDLKFGYFAEDEAPIEAVKNGEFNAADLKEWQSIIDNNVLGPVTIDTLGQKPCKTRFRRIVKTTARNEKVNKSRFLVCETHDPREVETATEMPGAWTRKMLTVLGLSRGWKPATIDIKTAFLLVKLPDDQPPIYIKLPHLPKVIEDLGYRSGSVHKLNRSLYGLKEAPRLFNNFLAEKLDSLGWEKITGGIFKRKDGRDGYLSAYVDDVMCFSPDPIADLNEIASVLKCSDLLPVDHQPQRHVGIEISMDEGVFFFDINNYIKEIPDFESDINALGPKYAEKPLLPTQNLPIPEELLEEAPSDISTLEYHIHLYQQVMGTLNWIGLCHPGVAARHGMLATYTNKPTPRAFRILKGVLHELRTEGLDPLEMTAVHHPEIRLWTDCSVHGHIGRRGWVIQIADSDWKMGDNRNMVAWRSVKDPMRHASSTSGEVNAIHQSLLDVDDFFWLLTKFTPDASFRLLTDSQSGLLQIVNGGHTFKDRARSNYIKELHSLLPVSKSHGFCHVSGLLQLADPLTKIKTLNWYSQYRSTLPKMGVPLTTRANLPVCLTCGQKIEGKHTCELTTYKINDPSPT